MANQNQLVAPITVDLRQVDNRLNIIKGIEGVLPKDEVMTAGVVTAGLDAGDWVVKGSSGLAIAGSSSVMNTYPLWVGTDQYDAQATGNGTILVGGRFIYRTTKYKSASYTAGEELTVKSSDSTHYSVPQAAASGDYVLATVYTAPDANNVMEIMVLASPYLTTG